MIKIPLSNLKDSRFDSMLDFLDLKILGPNVFLAGGALRSLLTGEKPIDYDIFFRRQEEVPEIRQLLEDGGFELKFECPEGKLFTYVFTYEPPDDGGPWPQPIKVQLILEGIGDPISVIDSFDISAGVAAMDHEFFYCSKSFIRSLITKEIYLHCLTYPVATIKRLGKYQKKGFSINAATKSVVEEIWTAGNMGHAYTGEDLRIYID